MANLQLRIEKVRDHCSVVPGACFFLTGPVVIGRTEDVDIVLAEKRVSRHHARITPQGDDWVLENLSRFGTYLNQLLIEEPTPIAPGDWIQIGGVLLEVIASTTATVPATGPMDPEEQYQLPVVLTLSPEEAVLFGRRLRLRPAALKALQALAHSAGQWVSFDHIAEQVWDDGFADVAYVTKHISYVRTAMREVLEAEPTQLALVRACIRRNADAYTQTDTLDEREAAGVLVEFIKARRKIGYRLHLAPQQIHWQGDEP
ncbi:MAG: FHA domain-containing protein [Myxococcota bacterium]